MSANTNTNTLVPKLSWKIYYLPNVGAHASQVNLSSTIPRATKNFLRPLYRSTLRFYSNQANSPPPLPPSSPKYVGASTIKVIRGRHPLLASLSKLFTFLKKVKPLTADHVAVIFSWFVFGTTFWVVVGTTTLLSTILWIVNTLRFQEWIAQKAGAYLTRESGIHVSFESAVGDWKQSTIRVQNVILAREGIPESGQSAIYLTIDRMDVDVSLLWMFQGKGFLKACKAHGVRGFVDRRPEAHFLANNPNYVPPPRRVRKRGDFEVASMTIEDLLIQLYLPDLTSNRPVPVSVYTMECDRFRKQWLFLDLLSAKSVVGKFDGCLFTFGVPQKEDLAHPVHNKERHPRARERELKIDGVPMSLLSKTATGPLGWIKEGTLDISLSITLPAEESNAHKQMVDRDTHRGEVGHELNNELLVETGDTENEAAIVAMDAVETMDLRFDVMFNHLRVVAPLYTPELSYLNNAVVHPILAYMNSHSKHIPLSFDVQIVSSALDGAWTPTDAGLWDGISASVALEFGRVVHDTQTTETLRNVANTLLKDCWQWLTGWVYTPAYAPA